jgi:hypothetical protein
MNNFNNNVSFFLAEKYNNMMNESDLKKMMDEFNEEIDSEFDSLIIKDEMCLGEEELNYFMKKKLYGNDELFYEEEYTVKDLLKICSYYGIDKDIRTSKCKKQDIISTLVYFESLHENIEIVEKRNRMWAYITELLNDPKMKKFVIFKN